MPRLTAAQRHEAIGMIRAGMRQQQVATHFQCHRNTISALVRRYQNTNDVADHQRSGRPRVTTPRQDRWIRVTHLRHRFQTAVTTSQTIPGLRRIHPNTVRNRLRQYGIRPRRPAIRPILTHRHRVNRLRWCRNHVRQPRIWWRNVVFTDETRFNISHSDGRQRVYRRLGERYARNCIVERNRFGGGSVMIWGGITARHRTHLVVVQGNLTGVGYRDQILRPVVIPFLQRHGLGLTFQQDNARPHTARVAMDFLPHNNVMLLPWHSPDLSPIEHVLDEMERRLRRLPHPPDNVRDLAQDLRRIWQAIPQAFHAHLVDSMRRRCTAVIHAQGGHTRY